MSEITDRSGAWSQQLNQMVRDLEAMQEKTDDASGQANALTLLTSSNEKTVSSAATVVKRIEQENGLNLEEFDGFHRSISGSVNETLTDITGSLDQLTAKIDDMLELKSTLEEVSYSIKNVSLLMKIKTRKMGKSEFDHVVKGLESLAGQIKENTEGINVSAQEAIENIMLTSEQINERLDRFNHLIKPSRDQVLQLQEMLEEYSADILKLSKQVAALAGQGEQLIASLLNENARLPEHRKRMLEIQETLNTSIQKLADEPLTLEDIHQIMVTLTGQIDMIAEWEHEIESGTQRFAKSISQLQGIVTEARQAADILKRTCDDLTGKMNAFESDFSGIFSTFTFSQEKTREILEFISAINENVTNVSRQVSQIDIGRTDLEALTYNAVFKAAKVGMQGKVMESITDEITGLSREMQSKVTDKEAVIKSIVSSSKEFKSSLSDKLNRQLEFSNEMNLKVREQCQQFYDAMASISGLSDDCSEWQDAVRQLADSESDTRELAGLMQKVQMVLADLIGEMQPLTTQAAGS